MAKKALLLTYYWPPGSGPGVQRWLKFCKFLPEFGWELEVITVKNGSYPSLDESLVDDIPDALQVFKTKSVEPFALYNLLRGKKGKQIEVGMSNLKGEQSFFKRLSNYIRANFFIPDARVGWNVYAYPMALKRVEKFKPDIIITTGPPHSTHLIGERIKALKGIPWVADFRDPWTNIYYQAYLKRTKATIQKDQDLEDKVLRHADGIIVASPGMEEEFRERAKKIRFIPNGYDEEDFVRNTNEPINKLKISYVGNLKSNQNLPFFWKAIKKFNTANSLQIELEITGNVAKDMLASLKECGINDTTKIFPFVPHKNSIQKMLRSHVLLLPIPQSENNKNILTGKLFEYLATRRPIISFGPTDGNASAILSACDKEPMLNYTDEAGIERLLHKFATEHEKNNGYPWVSGNEHYLSFSRKHTAETLSNYLETLL
jgi:glycosyltransferase involved in cell wall biosynthesis